MGQANQFGLALQPVDEDGKTQQKVAADAADVFLPLTDGSLGPTIATLEHVAMEGDRFPQRQKRGGRQFGGPANGGFRPLSTGVILAMLLGEPTTTTLQAGVYQHVFNPKTAGKHPMPATAWTIQNDIYEESGDTADKLVDEYIGTMVNEMAWNVEGNNYLLFTSALQALRNLEDVAAPVSTLDQTDLWSFDEVGMEIAVPTAPGGSTYGAYTPFEIYSWGFSYSNNLQGGDRFPVGSKEAVRLRPSNVESTIDMTVAQDLQEQHRKAISDYPDLVRVRLSAIGKQIYEGTTDLFESLTATFMGVEYRTGERPLTAADVWEDLEVSAGVVKDGSGGYLTITLVNTHDGSYYHAPEPA